MFASSTPLTITLNMACGAALQSGPVDGWPSIDETHGPPRVDRRPPRAGRRFARFGDSVDTGGSWARRGRRTSLVADKVSSASIGRESIPSAWLFDLTEVTETGWGLSVNDVRSEDRL